MPPNPQVHNVAIRIGNTLLEKWVNYSIELDMLTAADGFHLELGRPTRAAFNLCAPDAPVQVLLDDTTVLTGFIDDREYNVDRGAAVLRISGRDKAGRLADESAPLLSYIGLGIEQLAQHVVAPWFTKVTLQNTRNRALLRGHYAPKLKVASEPAIFSGNRGHKSEKKVAPGESRWHVLASFLEEAQLLAWSSADGKEFVVGLPNYEQEPSFTFFVPKENSDRAADANVLSYSRVDSVADRYSMVIACGSGHGGAAAYSDRVTRRRGAAVNGPGKDGVGKDFQQPKLLLVSDDDVRSEDQAKVRAERELAERDASGRKATLKVRGHSQRRTDGSEVLYAPDTMALIDDETTGKAGLWLITGVTFTHNRDEGEVTDLKLVPEGTVLR
jgi:prophage tail gpP-like protein